MEREVFARVVEIVSALQSAPTLRIFYRDHSVTVEDRQVVLLNVPVIENVIHLVEKNKDDVALIIFESGVSIDILNTIHTPSLRFQQRWEAAEIPAFCVEELFHFLRSRFLLPIDITKYTNRDRRVNIAIPRPVLGFVFGHGLRPLLQPDALKDELRAQKVRLSDVPRLRYCRRGVEKVIQHLRNFSRVHEDEEGEYVLFPDLYDVTFNWHQTYMTAIYQIGHELFYRGRDIAD